MQLRCTLCLFCSHNASLLSEIPPWVCIILLSPCAVSKKPTCIQNSLICSNIQKSLYRRSPVGPSSPFMYLVGMQFWLLTARIAGIRIISGGPGQSTFVLPEVTDGSVPGNLHRMEDRTENGSQRVTFCQLDQDHILS